VWCERSEHTKQEISSFCRPRTLLSTKTFASKEQGSSAQTTRVVTRVWGFLLLVVGAGGVNDLKIIVSYDINAHVRVRFLGKDQFQLEAASKYAIARAQHARCRSLTSR
jgi:hypothetical protein